MPNQCGECTACCDTFPVKWLNKPANERCIHACAEGCGIHLAKPSECRDFDCMWLQSSSPVSLRPDNCGVVFEKMSERIVYGTVFKPLTKEANEQTHAFVAQGFSVVLVSSKDGSSRAICAPGHDQEEINLEFQSIVGERCGNLRN